MERPPHGTSHRVPCLEKSLDGNGLIYLEPHAHGQIKDAEGYLLQFSGFALAQTMDPEKQCLPTHLQGTQGSSCPLAAGTVSPERCTHNEESFAALG